jgi:polysaccharide export outer membrane protein
MSNHLIQRVTWQELQGWRKSCSRFAGAFRLAAVALALVAAGCHTPDASLGQFSEIKSMQTPQPETGEAFVLHEGDSVRVTFPGAANLNTVQAIRRDGRITLPLIGEFKAAGLTPSDMEKELVKQYGPQLQTKEVNVAVESSAFSVYVTGAVLRPGKILSDRPMTALEAIMEAGGFDYNKANLKKVVVIRHENGSTQHQLLNLKKVLHGEQDEPFSLKRSDIIYVPEKFAWF